MKKTLLTLLTISSILCIECLYAQTSQQQRVDRRIYIWDVTRSMQGYKSKTQPYVKSIDVWDDVIKFLKDDINAITDSSTELIMLPFQERILDKWQVKATTEGKNELFQKIDGAKAQFQALTQTNIAGPFEEAKKQYVSQNMNNLIILLTDGSQSEPFGGQKQWLSLLGSWQEYAKRNNAYLIYFMVTEAAKNEQIIQTIANKPNSDVVTPSNSKNIPTFIDIYPQNEANFNIKDDQQRGLRLALNSSKKGVELASGLKMAVKSETNAPIHINEIVELNNNAIHIHPKYNFEELKSFIGGNEILEIPLTLELVNQDEIKQDEHQIVFLKSNNVNLRLINKLEKVLKISIKR
ncbi:MAG: VWA domain-containing protein [Rikenellaceae bacterium]|nr:VWA domain-containing protein [Rikenellaceae bacterium]